MGSVLKDCSAELVKIAKERDGYLRSVATLAPAAVASSLIDFPKGSIEKAVESRVGRSKVTSPKVKGPPAWHRGAARMGARLPASLATLPVFLDGIKDIKEGDTTKGALKVVGSGIAYSGIKGGLEGKIERKLSPESIKKTLRSPKNMAKVRGSLGALASLATATAVAKSSKDGTKKSKDGGTKSNIALPLAVGAVGGGLKGGIEELYDQKKRYGKIKTPRRIKGAIAGRATAGIIGAAALTHIADWAMKKKAADRGGILPDSQPIPVHAAVLNAVESSPAPFRRVDLGPKPGELYYQTLSWADKQPGMKVQDAFNKLYKTGDPERSPSRRAMYYALHDDLSGRGHKLPPPRMRDQVNPPVTNAPGLVEAGALAAVVLAPGMVWQQMASRVSNKDKDIVLRDALDRMAGAKGIYVDEMSKSRWEEGVQKALDDYRASNKKTVDSFYLRKGLTGVSGRPYPGPMGGSITGTTSFSNIAGDLVSKKTSVPWIGIEPGQRPSIMAHEMGHATGGSLQKALRSPLANQAYGAAKFSAIVLPLLALSAGHDSSFTTSKELEARANFSSAVGKIGLVAAAPKLTEEAIASAKAIKYLARAEEHSPDLAGKSRKALRNTAVGRALARGSRTLLPSLGAYAAPLALPFLAAKYLRNKAEQARRVEVAQRRQ